MVTFYELSAAADQDIQDIYDYAAQEYGEDQAEAYRGMASNRVKSATSVSKKLECYFES